MIIQTKEQRTKEIEFQNSMIYNLQKWMRNVLAIASCGVALSYWAFILKDGPLFTGVGIAAVIGTIICVICAAIIGYAIKNGKANVKKIVQANK